MYNDKVGKIWGLINNTNINGRKEYLYSTHVLIKLFLYIQIHSYVLKVKASKFRLSSGFVVPSIKRCCRFCNIRQWNLPFLKIWSVIIEGNIADRNNCFKHKMFFIFLFVSFYLFCCRSTALREYFESVLPYWNP